MDEALASKLKSWKTLDDVWMYGWLSYEFANESSLIGEVDYENMTISPKFGMLIGSGRENDIRNNIIINSEKCIYYDNRGREGALSGGWFNQASEGGKYWNDLAASPWQTELWQN